MILKITYPLPILHIHSRLIGILFIQRIPKVWSLIMNILIIELCMYSTPDHEDTEIYEHIQVPAS